MQVIEGNCTSAKIFTDNIEQSALNQIISLTNNESFKDCKIRIMPDVHAGKAGPIGFTSTFTNRVLPNIVGVDIGCGMSMYVLDGVKNVDFNKLDKFIRQNIPSGFNIRKEPINTAYLTDLDSLRCKDHINKDKAYKSIGTLGGGNHFIELDRFSNGDIALIVHTGSRHLGLEVCDYYLKAGQKELKSKGINVPYEMTYLEGTYTPYCSNNLLDDYIHDLEIVQAFAANNRYAILEDIRKYMKWYIKLDGSYSCIHNYIEVLEDRAFIRKGAISAYYGEPVIIPVNMRDGIIIGTGKGNPDWNYSAPHGAGRLMKRSDVKNNYTVSAFKKEMKGIYTTSVSADTLDEAPFVYKNIDEIINNIQDTVEVKEVIKPIYNFKAGKGDN